MDKFTRTLCGIFTRAGYWLKLRLVGLRKEAVMNRCTAGLLAAITVALLIAPAGAQRKNEADTMLEAARQKEALEGDLNGAIKAYSAVVAKYVKTDRAVTAMALVYMAECYRKMGDA